jgi:hypothetical protein
MITGFDFALFMLRLTVSFCLGFFGVTIGVLLLIM